jgi:hypothetical protein
MSEPGGDGSLVQIILGLLDHQRGSEFKPSGAQVKSLASPLLIGGCKQLVRVWVVIFLNF